MVIDWLTQGGARASLALGWLVDAPLARFGRGMRPERRAFPQWDARGKKFASDADDTFVIGTHQPGAPLTFDTTFSLNQPGALIATKVYLVLNTGNVAGSATITVWRPF